MPLTRGPRSDAADAIAVLMLGLGAAITVVLTVIARFMNVFREAGVAWRIDIDDEPFSASVGSGAGYVDGIVENALVIAREVDGGTAVALAGSIIAWGVASLVVIAAVMYVARSFLRGRLFVPATARAFDVIGWSIVSGALVILVLENIGRNGILAALGVDDVEPLHFLDFWAYAPAWAIGVAVGLIAIAFRRGVRLQRDTEGLV
ncbi:hypothetical protein ACI2K6_10290 [Microbacterium sp. NPDC006705]|uniref:hypothetical protein n=1 Tax=Microbacterium sp. NPDC006705 TaxID=3364181 RepID=UPI00384C31DD